MRLERQGMRRWLAVGILAVAMLVGTVELNMAVPRRTQSPEPDTTVPSEKAQLWVNDYKNLKLDIEDIGRNSIGLTSDAVQTKTELRLRSNGIRPITENVGSPPPDFAYLDVQVNVVGAAFSINLKFARMTTWKLPNGRNFTFNSTTWATEITGTHGSNSSYILEALDRQLDRFLNAYLKANQ